MTAHLSDCSGGSEREFTKKAVSIVPTGLKQSTSHKKCYSDSS